MSERGWHRSFDEPIELAGRHLGTLRDAGEHIAGLPAKDQKAPHWQAAAEALILVVEKGGPTMFARIGMLRAINHGRPAPNRLPRRAKSYRVIR